MLMVHSVTLARIDILPEDGPTGTETFRRFYEILAFLMCVNMCYNFISKNNKTRVQVVGCLTLYLIFLHGIKTKIVQFAFL
jgi:hypothetical protein